MSYASMRSQLAHYVVGNKYRDIEKKRHISEKSFDIAIFEKIFPDSLAEKLKK